MSPSDDCEDTLRDTATAAMLRASYDERELREDEALMSASDEAREEMRSYAPLSGYTIIAMPASASDAKMS